jgi:type I restriction enzyme, S subunit
MSSKNKTIATKEEAKPALVPKLRFPEFRDAWGWEKKLLGEVAPLQRGFDLPSDLIRPGKIPIVYSNGIQKYHEIGMTTAPGLVTGRSGTIGKLHFIESGEYWPHNTSLWVTDFMGNVPRFIYYLYDSIGMSRFSSGSGVPTLNRNDVHAFSSQIPKSRAEQQKIAECLSSVDELIAAQTRKLDALKTHKKGLMQDLFPREGETQPRLRFPEFQNAGEWEVKLLGRVAENLDNRRVPITSSDREAGEIPYYGASGIVDYVKGFIFDEDLLCVSEDGANLVARSYPIAFRITGKTWVNNHAHVLRFENACTQKFVEVYLNSIKLDDFITGMAQPKLNKAMLDSIPIPCPDASEQQRIADCLTSLDDLIAAQTQKIEALKTHKRGLMQQLFPSTVVEASPEQETEP